MCIHEVYIDVHTTQLSVWAVSSRNPSCLNKKVMTSLPSADEDSFGSSYTEVPRKVDELPCTLKQPLSNGLRTNQKRKVTRFLLQCCEWRNRLRSSDKFRRACDTSFLVTALIVTVVICCVPTVVYFAILVRSRLVVQNRNIVAFTC